MILQNLQIKGASPNCNIETAGITIRAVTETQEVNGALRFENVIAFPGLINSHDHLDFNSFPLLGNRVYDNYVPWGEDIHRQNKPAIDAVLAIPKHLRVQWSLYKNLLNGITTVVQHGERFAVNDPLIDVFQDCHSIHSVRLEKNWRLRLNKPRADNWPIVIHIGEGTNVDAAKEIKELICWNLFHKRVIGIHAVAMTPKQARHFAALVWSPDSNFFLLHQTADIAQLKRVVPILFGTDSTLTGSWNIWVQLRIAGETQMASPAEIYDMLTTKPAAVWGMPQKGQLAAGFLADIVIAESAAGQSFETSFLQTDPEKILLVLHKGNVVLFDASLANQLQHTNYNIAGFAPVKLKGRTKYLAGNLPALMHQIRQYHPAIVFPEISI